MTNGFDQIATVLRRTPRSRPLLRIAEIQSDHIKIATSGKDIALGHQVRFVGQCDGSTGEVISVSNGSASIVVEGDASSLCIGDPVVHLGSFRISPCDAWIGRIIDPWGRPLDDLPLSQGKELVSLGRSPPEAAHRRGLGPRLSTGLHALNTILPIARGQRLGLFAGSGVGKSNLLGTLATDLEADVCVVALVGERGREVGAFVRHILGKRGMKKSVVVVATSDKPALTRRRAAYTAMTVAEHFRDAGLHVLLIVDSVTRLAESHREITSAAGELPAMRGHPPSMVPLMASLAERAGPGTKAQGDITAVFSVLVAGADMDEPVADTLRGLLDGHFVLSRQIAERGRFPAIDILRSVSRALPDVANQEENRQILEVKRLLSLFEDTEILVRSGLYQPGTNLDVDRAVQVFPKLDDFIAGRTLGDNFQSFEDLNELLGEFDIEDTQGDIRETATPE